jgi:hypothetical protein
MTLLIGLGSKARQGKDYVAKYMQELFPEIKTYSFANELKKHCRDNHDEIETAFRLAKQYKGTIAKKDDPIYGYTPILQWYGTEVVRAKSPDHWVHVISDRIATERPEIAIITDVRFPNEANYIKNHDGYLVEVIRVKADGSRYLDPGRDPNHPSETALDDYLGFDFTIRVKDGDLDSLKAKAKAVMANILIVHHIGDSVPDATGDSQ